MFRPFYCFKKLQVLGLKTRIRRQREQQKRKDFKRSALLKRRGFVGINDILYCESDSGGRP